VEFPLAEVFERMGQPDSAIHHYERYIAIPNEERIFEDYALAEAHERLADLYEERGDRARTIQHAARFVDLWGKADDDLQPRVRARQDLLRRLTAEGGARR
jgi:tetratricopeptide (TPR) repeat protein